MKRDTDLASTQDYDTLSDAIRDGDITAATSAWDALDARLRAGESLPTPWRRTRLDMPWTPEATALYRRVNAALWRRDSEAATTAWYQLDDYLRIGGSLPAAWARDST